MNHVEQFILNNGFDSVSTHRLMEFGALGVLGLVRYDIKLHITCTTFEATSTH